MPKITIAITTYNRREYLLSSIRSILNQAFQDFKIIVFDSGSDYDIDKFIKDFDDSRIYLEKSSEKIDSFNNFKRVFNFGYESEYLMVFHDDDVMHPKLLETEVGIMERNKSLIWVGSGLSFVSDNSKMNCFKDKLRLKLEEVYDTKNLIRLILKNFHLAYDSVVYRVVYIEDISPFFKKFDKWNDRPFLIELSKKGKVAITRESLVNYRIHKNQDSQGNNSDKLIYLINLFNFYKENLSVIESPEDKKLFYSWSINNSILSAISFSGSFKEYINSIKEFKKQELFKFSYVNLKGLIYFIKALFVLVKREFIKK